MATSKTAKKAAPKADKAEKTVKTVKPVKTVKMVAPIKKDELRTYELTYILPGNFTDQEIEKAKTEIEPLFKRASMEVVQTEEWGKRPLAYIISHDGKKHREGYYVHQVVQMPASLSPALDREMYLHNRVMRHLLLVQEAGKVEKNQDQAKGV